MHTLLQAQKLMIWNVLLGHRKYVCIELDAYTQFHVYLRLVRHSSYSAEYTQKHLSVYLNLVEVIQEAPLLIDPFDNRISAQFLIVFFSCCGAGTAADTDMTTQLISSNLELHSLSTGRLPRVVTANRMLKQMLFR